MDLRPVFAIVGTLLLCVAGAMVLPAIADLLAENSDWQVFALSGLATLYMGATFRLVGRSEDIRLSSRHIFLFVALSWIIIPVFGALPFMFSGSGLSFTDSYFEAVSGITTTGSTIYTGLDTMAPGILLWRAMLQWLGGLGIVVMAISIFPMLQIGGMQVYRIEAFETLGKTHPRVRQISASISIVFVSLTVALAIALAIAGMSPLEAIVHAMTTIATGGYSTSDQSIAHFNSIPIEITISIGMLLGGLPFIHFAKFLKGDFGSLFYDQQVHWYFGILSICIVAVTLWLHFDSDLGVLTALRLSSFSLISIMTGTGYVSSDYQSWGGFPLALILPLTFLGGCAGSTACGIKVFRIQIAWQAAVTQIRRLIYPNAIFRPSFNNQPIDASLTNSVFVFFFFFFMGFFVLSIALTLVGLDLTTAFSAAATAISNVGPALGHIAGPTGNFQPLPDAAKWLLVAGMLLGRLEFLTFLALLAPLYWKK